MAGYYGVPSCVRPSVLTITDQKLECLRNFYKSCIHIVIGDEWHMYVIVNAQDTSIFNRGTILNCIRKMVSCLLFLYCLR